MKAEGFTTRKGSQAEPPTFIYETVGVIRLRSVSLSGLFVWSFRRSDIPFVIIPVMPSNSNFVIPLDGGLSPADSLRWIAPRSDNGSGGDPMPVGGSSHPGGANPIPGEGIRVEPGVFIFLQAQPIGENESGDPIYPQAVVGTILYDGLAP